MGGQDGRGDRQIPVGVPGKDGLLVTGSRVSPCAGFSSSPLPALTGPCQWPGADTLQALPQLNKAGRPGGSKYG